MDQKKPGCDRQSNDYHYFIRGRLPQWDGKLAEFAARSASVRAAYSYHADLQYGQAKRQVMDIFPAENGGRSAPIFIFVHGGYWRMMDKSQFSFIAPGLMARGITVAVVNYRLWPDTQLDEIVGDVKSAVTWLAEYGADFAWDQHNIMICGHSAGAHLAAHAACEHSAISGLIGISGVYDLKPIQYSFLNENEFLDDDRVARFGVESLVPRRECAALFACGNEEGAEFERQNRVMADKWEAQSGGKTSLMLDANHATSVAQLGNLDSQLFSSISNLINAFGGMR